MDVNAVWRLAQRYADRGDALPDTLEEALEEEERRLNPPPTPEPLVCPLKWSPWKGR